MIRALADKWWTFVVRGLLAILFGILALMYPAVALLTVMVFIGVFWLFEGVVVLFTVFGGKGRKLWPLIYSLLSIVAGGYVLTRPGISAIVLAVFIGFWAIVKGFAEIVTAIQIRKEIKGEFFLILAGLVSVLFGLILVFRPGAGVLALLWVLAVFAIVWGLLGIGVGFRLKGLKGAIDTAAAA